MTQQTHHTFLRPPERLDLDKADLNYLNVWLDAFDDYRSLCTSYTADADIIKLFLTIAGLPDRQLVDSFEPKPNKYADMVSALKNYIQPIKSIVMERYKFFTAKQLESESVTQYLLRLKQLATPCDFSNTSVDTIPNQLIRDQFITGVLNKKIAEALLQAGDIKLADATKKATSVEQAEKDLQNLASACVSSNNSVMTVTKENADKTVTEKPRVRCFSCQKFGHLAKDCPLKTQKPKESVICSYCKKADHKFENCFARATCSNCGKTGHTSNVCRNKAKAMSVFDKSCKLQYVKGTIFGIQIKFLIDPGATLSLVNNDFIRAHNLDTYVVKYETKQAILVDGGNISLSAVINADLCVNEKSFQTKLFVSSLSVDALLGLDVLSQLNFSMYLGQERIFALLPDFLFEYEDVFDRSLKESCLQNLECFEVITTPNEKPVRSFVRQFNKLDLEFLRNKVAELHEAGVIEVSHSPWRASPVIVDKNDGSKRLTINYKPVNAQTVFDAFPLPNVEELLSKLSGAKIFSKIDFSQFYHQIPLVESDRGKTAFFADGQLWQYTRMPFGLTNAVAACSRIMASIFRDVTNVLVYLDDILIFAPTQEEHDVTLRAVLDKIRHHNLCLNRKKCEFNMSNVNFLGFYIENGQIRPERGRISALLDFPLPQDLQALERFIGMSTYFGKFVQHFSNLCEPLMAVKNHLVRLSGRVSNPTIDYWSEDAKKSFDAIKSEIAEAVLVLPKPDQSLILRTDASDNAIGAVLQTESGQPVSFMSRVLNKAEANYDIVEKEALAVYWSIIRSKMFLIGRPFIVVSDHQPLEFLFSTEKVSPKVLRWRIALQEFNFKIVHCKGKENAAADCLSRVNCVDFAPPMVSLEYIVKAQSFDSESQSMLRYLSGVERDKPDDVTLQLWSVRSQLIQKNDTLFHKNGKIFVPKAARLKVLTLCHGLHRGISTTHSSVRESCFWPGDRKAVDVFVSNCRICSLVRPKYFSKPCEPLATKSPLEILAMDHVGPLPESNGYRYILTVIDMFSKYAFAFPVRDLSAATVVEKCKEVFSLVGFPDAILTDRGTAFMSDMFLSFIRKFNVRKLSTNSFSPHSNGCCERFNGTLQKKIFAYLKQQGLSKFQWTKSMPGVLLDYRTSVHSTTGCRPVDLFFNFKVLGSSPCVERINNKPRTNANKAIPMAHDMAEKNKNIVGKRNSGCLPSPGDEVLVKFPTVSKFKDKGQLGIVDKIINAHTIKVTLQDGTWVNVNPSRVSAVKPGSISSQFTHQSVDTVEPDEDVEFTGTHIIEQPCAERAPQRHRHPPVRLGIDDVPIYYS